MTEHNQPMHVDKLPPGYRWATAYETEIASHSGDFSEMVQVRVGGTDSEPQTDLAIPDLGRCGASVDWRYGGVCRNHKPCPYHGLSGPGTYE